MNSVERKRGLIRQLRHPLIEERVLAALLLRREYSLNKSTQQWVDEEIEAARGERSPIYTDATLPRFR